MRHLLAERAAQVRAPERACGATGATVAERQARLVVLRRLRTRVLRAVTEPTRAERQFSDYMTPAVWDVLAQTVLDVQTETIEMGDALLVMNGLVAQGETIEETLLLTIIVASLSVTCMLTQEDVTALMQRKRTKRKVDNA